MGVDFEFCDAVDGRDLPMPAAGALTRGEMACSLSHWQAWRRLLAGSAPGAFVIEDDARREPWCSPEVLAEVVALARPGEVVLLQRTARMLWLRQRRRLPGRSEYLAYTLDDTVLATAYYVTRAAAAAMNARWEREGIQFCVDHWHWKKPRGPAWAGTVGVVMISRSVFTQRPGFVSETAALGRTGWTGVDVRPVHKPWRWRNAGRDMLRWVRRACRNWLARPPGFTPSRLPARDAHCG